MTMLLVVGVLLDDCFASELESPFVSLTLWSYADSTSQIQNFTLQRTQRTDAKSLAFEKVGVSENVTAVMIYERASATVEHSTECSDLYLSS
ncbi:hypothetical protein PF007_g17178 [Phytophthora fragariae]|nr:hypothetical protein PF007_g17178 [Phytophthora fragariae]